MWPKPNIADVMLIAGGKKLFIPKDWFYETGLGRVEWWERNWKLFQLFLQKDPVFQLAEELAQEGGTITV